jgi:diacylglycerol kinase
MAAIGFIELTMLGQTRFLLLTLVLVAAVTFAHQAQALYSLPILCGMVIVALLLIINTAIKYITIGSSNCINYSSKPLSLRA